MARSNESTNSGLPVLPDQKGYRHFGDGLAGEITAARIQGFYPTAADYRDIQVDVNGVVQTSAGAGGGGAATIADGADVAQGATTDLSTANTVVGLLKAIKAAVQGTLTTARSWTLSSATDSVNVGNFPATQAVSIATNTPDVTDRAARLLGHVTVDSAPTTTVTGTVTANIGTAGTLALDATLTGGTQKTKLVDTAGTNVATVKAASTAPAATDTALLVDLRRTPSEGTAIASASHAIGTFTFDIADTTGYTGIAIITDLTVLGASSTVTNTIQVKDPVTAKFASATAASFTAISTVSTTRQAMHPANTGATGNLQGGVMTKAVRVSMVVATAASTFSVGYSLTP